MIHLRYRPNPEAPWARVKFPADKDPADICNAVRDRLFPDVKLPKRDAKFEAVIAARKA